MASCGAAKLAPKYVSSAIEFVAALRHRGMFALCTCVCVCVRARVCAGLCVCVCARECVGMGACRGGVGVQV